MSEQNLPSVLVDINVFFLDESWAGVVNAIELPDIEYKTEEQIGSGTGGELTRMLPILKSMKVKQTVSNFNPKLSALVGNPAGRDEPLIYRGAVDSDSVIQEYKVTIQADWFKRSRGKQEVGGVEVKSEMEGSVVVYTEELDGEEHLHIDIPGKICRVDGVDRWADIRKALGKTA
jgi:P2 family phage contractile tail tube protein